MKQPVEYAQAVVIGGGIAGCSTLYHLTKCGWHDVVLLERDELTSGTTWHSAGQVTGFGTSQTMIGLKAYSIKLYRELSSDSAYPVNYNHADGGIRLATEQWQMDGYWHFASMARGMGVQFEVISADECRSRHPLLETDGLLGGLWDPEDGHVDPAQLCMALAFHARRSGAKVYRQTPVVGMSRERDGRWHVHTPTGKIVCRHVVNACGYRVNEVAAMMDTWLPVVSMEHQHVVTEAIPEVAQAGRRLPLLRCPTDDFYSRQEQRGLLVGFYEQNCQVWGMSGIDPGFSRDLLPEDYDRMLEVFERAERRLPVLQRAGIANVINGPITYSADGLPLVGRVPGHGNAWCIVGLRAGIGEGGGHGWLLAQLMVHGEACYDTWCLDPRRFGSYADSDYCRDKAVEDYRNEFRFHLPREHRPAGRPARVTQLTDSLVDRGAEFAPINGWERSSCFPSESIGSGGIGFRRNVIDEIVRSEVLNVHRKVGISEVCGFTRIEIFGSGAYEWLARLSCSRVPRRQGRIGLCYFLNSLGCVKSEATIANLGDSFWYCSAAAAEHHDFEWLSDALPSHGSIGLTQLTESIQAIVVAGPDARRVLERGLDEGKHTLPRFLGLRRMRFAGIDMVVYCLSYCGELAFELHVPAESLAEVWSELELRGAEFGVRPYGSFAADSMRIEKGFRHWKADLLTEFDPFEAGLDRFVDLDKTFFGSAALSRRLEAANRSAFRTLAIDCDHAKAQHGSSIVVDDKVVGTITSAGFGYRTGLNLAMGYLEASAAEIGSSCEVDIIDERWQARVIEDSPYDPGHLAMRS
ncbi:MAG: FAD-dependent oxidoreductase [Rhodobacteraceae bacterium]|nr:FAD-dependent oxidoreductase [Paracoccaceae bacterium]